MKKEVNVLRAVFSILIGISMLIAFIFLGNKEQKEVEKKDAEKFSEVYPVVDKDNVFVYRTLKEINKMIEADSGIIFLGFPACQWCQTYVKYVNEIAKEMQIDKIYYFDIYHDRNNNSPDYQKTVKLLSEHLPINDNNDRRVYVPNLTVVKDGKILFNDNETATIFTSEPNPVEKYWTEEKEMEFKNKLRLMFADFSPICTNCNE